jgi:hypothetical protein
MSEPEPTQPPEELEDEDSPGADATEDTGLEESAAEPNEPA